MCCVIVRMANFEATLERVDRLNAANTTAHFTTTKYVQLTISDQIIVLLLSVDVVGI
jgi:hypothetical protein